MIGAEQPEPRVQVVGGNLVIGKQTIALESLDSWGGWSAIETALKKLDSAPTASEWDILEKLAGTLAAKNGLAEVKSALSRTKKA